MPGSPDLPIAMTPIRSGLLLAPLAFLLAGCLQDTASYTFPEKDHAITLVRNQTWPWESTLSLEVVAIRLPECHEGGRVEGVKRDSAITLFKAPDEYAEPIFILQVDGKDFAVSTQSCRVQKFEEAPPDRGQKLGVFKEKDGKFGFVAEGV
ncbi:MAG: hypothetical protein AB1899_08510 [Pseudomonadota bacterium]